MTSTLAIEATGLVKSFGETRAVDGVDLAGRSAAPSTACSGPTAPARRRRSACSPRCCAPTPAARACSGTTSSTEADAVRGLVSLTGQLASVDDDLTGRENLILLGRLLGYRTKQARARADELLAAFGLDGRGRPAREELLRRHAAPARHRRRASSSRRSCMFLDEPTTGLDPRSRNQVWDIIRALAGAGHDGPAVHAVPRRGRPARRPHRRDRPRQGRSPRARRRS